MWIPKQGNRVVPCALYDLVSCDQASGLQSQVGPYPQHRMEGIYRKDMSLPKAPFDWFYKELNSQ